MCDGPKGDDGRTAQLLRKCTLGQRFVVVLMYGRLEWVGCDGGGGGVWLKGEEEGEGEG